MRKLFRLFLLFTCSFIFAFSTATIAAPYQYTKYAYYSGPVHCERVGGYWRHGYWHPPRRFCWKRNTMRRGGCVWISGHWRHGVWYRAHRVCR